MEMVLPFLSLALSLGFLALSIWMYVRIARRAGYSGWWSLTMFVPIVNIVVVWLFAFADWPTLRADARRRRTSEGAAPSCGYAAGGTIVDRGVRREAAGHAARPTPAGGWLLAGFDGAGRAVRLEIPAEEMERRGELTIGRSPDRSDLVLEDASVSRRHARLSATGNRISVEDLESSNGTAVDGRWLEPGEVADIPDGSEVRFGEARLRLTSA